MAAWGARGVGKRLPYLPAARVRKAVIQHIDPAIHDKYKPSLAWRAATSAH